MSVYIADISTDQTLDYLANNITEMRVCSGDPGTRASAITLALATRIGLSAGVFTGPSDGTVSGRKIVKDAESGVPVSATGTAAVVCFTTGSTLLWKVDLTTPQPLTAGGTVDVGSVEHEVADVV